MGSAAFCAGAAAVGALAFGASGCAAAFRESRPTVHVESDPLGADIRVHDQAKAAPADLPVPRSGITEVHINMPGFEEHHGTVRKSMNRLWLTADLATCIVPVMLCIPLLVDAITGAWFDVQTQYRARLVPFGAMPTTAFAEDGSFYGVRRATAPPTPTTLPPPPVASAPPTPTVTISDSERKAAARAAYQEGIELQGQKSYLEALARFQYAQRMYDAPTHQLHIAQCLVMTSKLVEAQESYEAITHRELPASSPAPFREAVDMAKRELAELQPRIPTLRIQVQPAPATLRNLVLNLNGHQLPNEVIGIARPVNPGTYHITATAWGIQASKPVDISLAESETRSVDIKLGR